MPVPGAPGIFLQGGRMGILENRYYGAIFIFVLSVCIYIPSLNNGFVWDDVETIENSYYRFKASSLGGVVIPDETIQKEALYYRPLVYMSMVVDKAIWGVSEFGFHLTNVILNALSAAAFYLLACLVLSALGCGPAGVAALFSGALFALYPMHVESVSWVSGRTDILCGLFFFLAFIFHVMSRRRPVFLPLAAASFALSLLSKETAVVFPLTVLLYDLLSGNIDRKNSAVRYSVYITLLAVYFYLRGRAFINLPGLSSGRVFGPEEGTRTLEGIAGLLPVIKASLGAYFLYLTKLVFPFRFNAFIDTLPISGVYILSCVAALAVMTAAAVSSVIRKENVIAFSILWILITLLPSLPVALTGVAAAPAAERYLYIPSAGLCMFAGFLLARALTARPARLRAAAALLIFIVALSYLSFTILRQGVWNDSLTLWRDTARKSPSAAVPHINYGMALLDAGRHDEAIGELMKNFGGGVRATDRIRSVTANNIGVVYVHKKELDEADKWFKKAYGYDPGYYKTNYHLGLVNYMKGKKLSSPGHLKTSENYIRRALAERPNYGKAYLLLAMVCGELGDRAGAARNARLAIESGLTEPLNKKARAIIGGEN